MGLFDKIKYHKTDFTTKAGDIIMATSKSRNDSLKSIKVPEKFLAPRKIDSRDMCLSSSNQGRLPHCGGYSTAGYIEYHNWRTKHFPEQVDGDLIYKEAKKVDGYDGDGTYLWAAIEGAMNAGLIEGNPVYLDHAFEEYLDDTSEDVIINMFKFALHQYGTVIAGFNITDEWDWVDKKTGKIRVFDDPEFRGGHAVLLCGYDSYGVYIQNSWGDSWGHHGFGCLSWEQFDRQAIDGMVIEAV